MKDLFNLPERTTKPRDHGITMVMDSGLSIAQTEHMLETGSNYIDYVKLGWGTIVVTPNIKQKLKIYQQHSIPVCVGGTLFELAVIQSRVDELVSKVLDHGIQMIEVSDGSIDIDHQKKLDYISQLSEKFIVLSEFGSKDNAVVMAPSLWVKAMMKELEAGAWKVIAEGREAGNAGLYRQTNEIRTGLVDEIVLDIPHEKIIWETPLKEQQVWFIKKFGSNVNLGNIAPENIISLETLRLGLRADTVTLFAETNLK